MDKSIIVVGSKYEDGKVIFAKGDKMISKEIRNKIMSNKKKINIFNSNKMGIKKDRDIYFSEYKKQNLIVVGGISINKISADLNDKLPIRYTSIINYYDEKFYNYLIYDDYEKFYNIEDIKKCYTIQVIKNPYNNNPDNQTYIIVLFGLTRVGTDEAGKKFITMLDNDFFSYINKSGCWSFIDDL